MREIAAAWEEFLHFSPGPRRDVRVFHAPGRVNLIGEHLDYNGGPVLPAALSLGVWLFARPRLDGVSRFASQTFAGIGETPIADVRKGRPGDFANYPKGVYQVMGEHSPFPLPAADLYYAGNLPSGAGLASSAAVEVATALALSTIGELGFTLLELAQMAQRAENEFVGVQCGIMDQLAIAMGREGHAILLHSATLRHEYIPVPLPEHCLVIAHSGKTRELAASKYNERRLECRRAFLALAAHRPELCGLADGSVDIGEESVGDIVEDPQLLRRLRHVFSETRRVQAAAAALRQGQIEEFGRQMSASHRSLRDDFEVTGAELDRLAESAWQADGCLGSRMTGAGFGGCTVSLVRRDAVDAFRRQVTENYCRATGITPTLYVSDIAQGAREVTDEVR